MSTEIYLRHIENLEILRGKIHNYIEQQIIVNELDLKEDIRHLFLTHWDRVLIAYYLGLIDVYRNTTNPEIIKNLFKSDDKGTLEILKTQDRFLKLAFISVFSSIIENFLRSIYKVLFKRNSPKSIYSVRKELFKELNMSEVSDQWKAFSIFSNIRNTIHNNGIYTEKTLEIVYKETLHLFTNGKPHNSASLETIVLIQEDLFEMTKNILEHPKISTLDKVIDPSSIF